MTFHFDRYANGRLMADGIGVNRATSLEEAVKIAIRLAMPGDVLVYKGHSTEFEQAPTAYLGAARRFAQSIELLVEVTDFDGNLTAEGALLAEQTARAFIDRYRKTISPDEQRRSEEVPPLTIDYTNWRGERRIRSIIPTCLLMFGSNAYHKEPQWLMEAIDPEDGQTKSFAFAGIHGFGGPAEAPTHVEEPRAERDEAREMVELVKMTGEAVPEEKDPFAPGWLRKSIHDAIRDLSRNERVSNEQKERFARAWETLDQSGVLRRAEEGAMPEVAPGQIEVTRGPLAEDASACKPPVPTPCQAMASRMREIECKFEQIEWGAPHAIQARQTIAEAVEIIICALHAVAIDAHAPRPWHSVARAFVKAHAKKERADG